jgi:hypothetical protein
MYGLSNSSPTWEYILPNDYYFESAPLKKPGK